MRLMIRRSWSIVMLFVLGLFVLSAGVASAHADFKSSIPAPDSTVATAPTTVTVVFENHDALQAEGSVLKVTGAGGTAVDKGDTALDKSDPDRKTLIVSLNAGLGNGVYTVNWAAASSADGSVAEGSFKFTVGDVPAAPANLPRTGEAETTPWATLLGGTSLLLGFGLLLRRSARRGIEV